MEEEHTIDLPLKVIVGPGVARRLPSALDRLTAAEKVLLLTGPHVKAVYDDSVIRPLREGGFATDIRIVKRATITEVQGLAATLGAGVDIVVGLGGGRVLDVGKVLAYTLKKPFVSVPTSASHDGIASPQASLVGLNGTHSVRVRTPYMVLADSDIISRAPRELTLSGMGDVLAKFSSVLDTRYAKSKGEYVGDYAVSLAEMSARLVFDNLDSIAQGREDAVRTLIEALISNGIAMAIAGSSRPCSGSEHMFGHALDYLTNHNLLHGFTVALGTKISLSLHGKDWESFHETSRRVGLPMSAKDLHIPPVYVARALSMASKIRPERTTILGSGLTYSEAVEVVKRVMAV
jgi:glycerol-1-phosphate dehydrogenase [NAD(P)+]